MNANQQTATLVEWATKHGAQLHPSVEVYEDSKTGLSFRVKPSAATPIQPYEPIVTIPSTLTLSYVNALADNSPESLAKELLTGLAPHVIGRLFLVKEYLKGQDSFWWPYIQALPQPENASSWALPPFWDSDDIELFDGTNVEVGIQKIRADVKNEISEIQKLLALHQRNSSLAQSFQPVLYHWAYCIFSSRSFRPSLVLSETQQKSLPKGVKVDDFSVLLPLFDIGNHDMTNTVRWELGAEASTCTLRVGKEHAPGEQVYNNYSMKTNAELLLGYGFMIPTSDELHNDYIHVRKRTNDPGPSEEYFISLRPMNHPSSVLGRSKQLPGLAETPVLRAFQHVQPAMVWDIFCALVPEQHQLRLLPALEGLEGEASDARRQQLLISGQAGEDCREILEHLVGIIQHKVMQELERLMETDVEVSGQDNLERNQLIALQYRERCRKVLENTLEAIDADEFFEQGEEQEEPQD
jgi:hypothetical protein